MSNSNRKEVKQACVNAGIESWYIGGWFGSDCFSGTVYETSVIKGKYFITRDTALGLWDVRAVREITPDGIKTLESGFDSLELALNYVEGLK